MVFARFYSRLIPLIVLCLVWGVDALPLNVGADSCRTVRLDGRGGPFEKIPVYNQQDLAHDGDLNICNSIATSELIDAHRFITDPLAKGLTSPVSVAVNYKSSELYGASAKGSPSRAKVSSELLAAGSFVDTVLANQGKLVCDQKFLTRFLNDKGPGFLQSSRLRIGHAKTIPSTENFLEAIIEQSHVFSANLNMNDLRIKSDKIEKSDPEIQAILGPYFCANSKAGKSNLQNIVDGIEAASLLMDPLAKIKIFLSELCRDHQIGLDFPKPQEFSRKSVHSDDPTKLNEERNKRLKLKVDELLNSPKPIPVGIGFCHDVISVSTDFQGVTDTPKGYTYDCSPHGAVIIGRNFNQKKNSCEYLVRDSYGSACKNKQGEKRFAADCENGNMWVDSNTLMKSTFELTWIPNE